MKVLMLLGLVGAAIYGALVLSSDLFPRPAENAFAGRSLGNPSDRQLSSWGTDLPSLARSSSQEASLPLPKPTVTAASTSPSAGSEGKPTTVRPDLLPPTATQTAMATPARKVAGEAATGQSVANCKEARQGVETGSSDAGHVRRCTIRQAMGAARYTPRRFLFLRPPLR